MSDTPATPRNPLWYKDAVIYEAHVRAFHDSSNDGRGDFRGLTQKLDYLQDLGITAIWLLPFYPSPQRDDGYDIADYTDVHPMYGTLADFREFLRAAHARGLRVITELVLNHTSDRHPWFQRARQAAPGSPERDYYVWSTTHKKYEDARIIFRDYETSNWTWDPVANAYYWHRFFSHQPDLNFESARVQQELLRVIDFWMKLGVDGMRLDAVPYLFEEEGTNCENLPGTHEFLKKLRAHVDRNYQDRMLLAEANQWPEDAVAYFGNGDECQMAFHFPVMPRLFMSVHMENRYPLVDILRQTPAIPDNCQWALFLRNHDELTLEMVTDEERDYMYRMYAKDERARINLGIRRRLAPLLGNNRRRVELLTALLLSLPGTPVLYYGDEIGMGDNIYLGDRDSVRTPMQWSGDRNAGFSRANPQKLFLPVVIDPEYHYEAVNVEAQASNPNSLLWWHRRILALRRRYTAFGRGTIELLEPENYRVLAFLRRHGTETILCVANLSRFVQHVEVNLAEFHGLIPVELFSRSEFPAVGVLPYQLTLGPHDFFWFSLEPREDAAMATHTSHLAMGGDALPADPALWMTTAHSDRAARVLRFAVASRPYLSEEERAVRAVHLRDVVPLDSNGGPRIHLVFIEAEYRDHPPQPFCLPLTAVTGTAADAARAERAHDIIAPLDGAGGPGLLLDASGDGRLGALLFALLVRQGRLRGEAGRAAARSAKHLRRDGETAFHAGIPIIGSRTVQGNLVFNVAGRYFLKVFLRPNEGLNPDVEIGEALGLNGGRAPVPSFAGRIDYESPDSGPRTLAILQEFVPHQGTADQLLLDHLHRFYEEALAAGKPDDTLAGCTRHELDLLGQESPEPMRTLQAVVAEPLRLLGQRLAEFHATLAAVPGPEFQPEPFSTLYQRSLYQALRNRTNATLSALERRKGFLTPAVRPWADALLRAREPLDERFRRIMGGKMSGMRSRVHNDMHLGQILFTGRDFTIVDFEGDTRQPLSERRIRRSPLRDVAALLWSLRCTAFTPIFGTEHHSETAGRTSALEDWGRCWQLWASVLLLDGYFSVEAIQQFLPESVAERKLLLDIMLLDKALIRIEYAAVHHPDRLQVPLHVICRLLGVVPADDGEKA